MSDPRLVHPGHVRLIQAAEAVKRGHGLPFLNPSVALVKLRAGYAAPPPPQVLGVREQLLQLLGGRG